MAKGITPITNTTDINAIVRQANANFQILSNRTLAGASGASSGSKVKLPGKVTDDSQFVVYYDASGIARVVIGAVPNTGDEVVAVSNDGINVLDALKKTPLAASDFAFNSLLVNASITNLQNSLNGLRTRMTTAETNIATNTTNIATNTSDIADLADRVADLEDRMDAVETELADHETRITALEGGTT